MHKQLFGVILLINLQSNIACTHYLRHWESYTLLAVEWYTTCVTITAQKMKLSFKDFFGECEKESADLATFTE